jgi:hypothetical protein
VIDATQHHAALIITPSHAAPGAVALSITITGDDPGPPSITIEQPAESVDETSTLADLATLEGVAEWLNTHLVGWTAAVPPIYPVDHAATSLAPIEAAAIEAATGHAVILPGDTPAPVIEAIAEVIHARLRAIRTSLTETGNLPADRVIRSQRLGAAAPAHLMIELKQDDSPTRETDNDIAGPAVSAYTQTFSIDLYSMLPDQSPLSDDTILNTLHAELVRAVTLAGTPAGAAVWHRFATPGEPDAFAGPRLAIDAGWPGEENWRDFGGEIMGRTVRLDVTYRIEESNPYQRG